MYMGEAGPDAANRISNAVEVLYRHPDFVAVNKPAGVAVQQQGWLGAVATALAEPRLWLVHRLDRETSGVLLLARHAQAAATLGGLFATQTVDKTYWAVARGRPAKKQGWVRGDMAKSRRGCWKLLRSCRQPATTRFDSHSLAPGLRLYRLRPYSGKTHQLRVAMKSLGCPILGDLRYGGDGAERLYLHARQLAFVYDGQAQLIRAEARQYWPQPWKTSDDLPW